jgi:type I restriction enzyme, R subunit
VITMNDYSEDTLVEQSAIALFSQLGYQSASCFYEKVGAGES